MISFVKSPVVIFKTRDSTKCIKNNIDFVFQLHSIITPCGIMLCGTRILIVPPGVENGATN